MITGFGLVTRGHHITEPMETLKHLQRTINKKSSVMLGSWSGKERHLQGRRDSSCSTAREPLMRGGVCNYTYILLVFKLSDEGMKKIVSAKYAVFSQHLKLVCLQWLGQLLQEASYQILEMIPEFLISPVLLPIPLSAKAATSCVNDALHGNGLESTGVCC